jgi:hypothetical protein
VGSWSELVVVVFLDLANCVHQPSSPIDPERSCEETNQYPVALTPVVKEAVALSLALVEAVAPFSALLEALLEACHNS